MRRRLKKRKIKWRSEGSFTLEAALLMPLILSCIVIIIYISFYIHNQVILYSIAYESTLKASQLSEEEQKKVNNMIDELLEQKLLGAGTIKKQVEIEEKNIKVSLSGSMNLPGFEIIGLLISDGSLNISGKSEVQIRNTVELIRNYRLLDKLKTVIEE